MRLPAEQRDHFFFVFSLLLFKCKEDDVVENTNLIDLIGVKLNGLNAAAAGQGNPEPDRRRNFENMLIFSGDQSVLLGSTHPFSKMRNKL